MGWGTTGFSTPVKPFDVDSALKAYQGKFDERKGPAAQFLLTEMQKRIPVRHDGRSVKGHEAGAMRNAASVTQTENGFVLKVEKYYAWFVEKGHLIGARSSRRARLLGQTAKELRRARKETGDESLKQKESQYRKAAKEEQKGYEEQRVAGKSTTPNPFVERTINEARAGLIEILSGKQS